MSIARIRDAFPYFAHFLVIFTALVCCPRPAVAQTTDSPGGQVHGAQSASGTSTSSDQASEDRQQPSTSSVICRSYVMANSICASPIWAMPS